MKTAISDDEARLMKIAQINYDDANRQMSASESCVARVLKISHHQAAKMLKRGAIDSEIDVAGVEIYQASECRSAWPDKTTLGVWMLMLTGSFFAVWMAGVV